MPERIAILGGIRTPYVRSGGLFESLSASELGRFCVTEVLERLSIPSDRIGVLVAGQVSQPTGAVNTARVISLRSGIPEHVPAYTVNGTGASGILAVVSAAQTLALGEANLAVAAGVESMSGIPLLLSGELRTVAERTPLWKRLRAASLSVPTLRPRRILSRGILARSLTDPTCGLTMGETAEVLARELSISRDLQDEYALMSQVRASAARDAGRFTDETMTVLIPPAFEEVVSEDDVIRTDETLKRLSGLKPLFDKRYGSVTAGNSSRIADGGATVVLSTESEALRCGMEPLGFIRGHVLTGFSPRRMGLGSAPASGLLLEKTGVGMAEIGLVELHEAFAAQVIANERVFSDDRLAGQVLGRRAPGRIDRSLLNVNGGAIALGHPMGSSGVRMVLTLLLEMHRRGAALGLVAVCVGGGQGAALLLEAA